MLKPTMGAAGAARAYGRHNVFGRRGGHRSRRRERLVVLVAQRLQAAFGVGMVAVTGGCGGQGLPTAWRLACQAYEGVKQVDATGAGDTFFGGMIAGCMSTGAKLPVKGSRNHRKNGGRGGGWRGLGPARRGDQ